MNSFTQVQYIKLFTKTKHNQSVFPPFELSRKLLFVVTGFSPRITDLYFNHLLSFPGLQ